MSEKVIVGIPDLKIEERNVFGECQVSWEKDQDVPLDI